MPGVTSPLLPMSIHVSNNSPPSFQCLPFRLLQEPFFLPPGASSKGNSQVMRQSLGVKPPTFPAVKKLQTTEVPPFPVHETPSQPQVVSSLATPMTGVSSCLLLWLGRQALSVLQGNKIWCLNFKMKPPKTLCFHAWIMNSSYSLDTAHSCRCPRGWSSPICRSFADKPFTCTLVNSQHYTCLKRTLVA